MVAEEVINASTEALTDVILEVGRIGKWMQALGLFIIFYLIFQIIIVVLNRRKKKLLELIRQDIKRLEKKIDRKKI